jgi:nitrous oxidase accessory protein NosD
VLPAAACTGASREALGETQCVPLGDCAAPFPPAGADLFVSPTGPVDATHFRRVGDAIAAAKNGSVIAVDSGSYAESIDLAKNITVVGRCAERVRLGGSNPTARPAIVSGASAPTVRGIAIVDADVAVQVESGTILLEDVLVEHNADVGVFVFEGAKARVVRSVIRDTFARTDVSGTGLQAVNATLEIVESVVARNEGGGVLAGEPSGKVTIERSVFRDNESDRDGEFGLGINVTQSATAKVSASAFLENRRAALRAGPKAKVEIEDVVVRGTRADANGGVGHAFFALGGATLTAKRVAASDLEGPALTVLDGAKVTIETSTFRSLLGDSSGDNGSGAYVFEQGRAELIDTAVVDGTAIGIQAFDKGSSVSLQRSLIATTRPGARTTMGAGVVLGFGASGTIADSSIVANRHSGVYLFEGSSVDIAGTLVRRTEKEVFEDRLGHGLLVQDAPRVTVLGSVFDGNVGIGLAIAGSAALIRSSVVRGNAVGIHVEGTELREASEAVEISPGEVIVSADTTFVGNATKVGSGVLALPEPPVTKKP